MGYSSALLKSFVCTALISGSALADNSQRCADAYTGQNWTLAKQHCLDAAQNNTADKQTYYILAQLNKKGLLESENPWQAKAWLEKAANKGHAQAQFELGQWYEQHNAYKDSFYWYSQSSNQGHTLATSALSQHYKNGLGINRDYRKAKELMRVAAERGDMGAQLELAFAYEKGRGVKKDLNQAMYWYQLAAEQGSRHGIKKTAALYRKLDETGPAFHWSLKAAQNGSTQDKFLVAEVYREGQGTQPNLNKAFHWMREAARDDHTHAQWKTANLYQQGVGTEQNIDKALYWYKRAANNGHRDSLYQMGLFHKEGMWVEQDLDKAADYFQQAALKGHPKAKLERAGNLLQSKSGFDNRHAATLYKQAADRGDSESQYVYGKMLYVGMGIEQDKISALSYLTQAANAGHVRATGYLAKIYQTDPEFHDSAQVVGWLNRASQHEIPQAQYELAMLFAQGKWVEKDRKQALRLFERAAQAGHPGAQAQLAKSYQAGIGVPQNDHLAQKWYRKAAYQGDYLAQYNLAQMYFKGVGVKKDHIRAYSWMSIAAATGRAEAMQAQNQWKKRLSPAQIRTAQNLSTQLTKANY